MKLTPQTIIWITGASSGIGKELALQLADYKPYLILSARRTDKLESVSQLCKKRGAKVTVVPLDLEQPESINKAYDEVQKQFPHVDLLVNNAGISQRSQAIETSMEVYRRLMEINFFGTIHLTKLVLPTMLQSGKGHIVTVTSLAGKVGFPLRSAYSASKFALHGFFETLMTEVADTGIKVTLAVPSHIKTEIAFSALRGDGEPFAQEDPAIEKGIPAEKCAKKIIRAIEKDKTQVLILGKDYIGYVLHKISPKLFRFVVQKFKLK